MKSSKNSLKDFSKDKEVRKLQTEFKTHKIETDRTKANSKKAMENCLYTINRLKRYGIDIIIRTNFAQGHELYQAHTMHNGKPCEKVYSYFAVGRNLAEVHTILHGIVSMFQDKYIFETHSKDIKNESLHTWKLVEVSKTTPEHTSKI